VIGLIVFVTIMIVSIFLIKSNFGNSETTTSPELEQVIAETVAAIKLNVELPMTIDEYTTWTDITAEPEAIRYHYQIIADSQMLGLTDELLSLSLIEQGCTTPETRTLLETGINMNYTYTFNQPDDVLSTSVSITDCDDAKSE